MKSKNNIKLFFSIVLWYLLPSIYFLIRAHFIASSNADINIMGQMEWFDLIDEVISTALTLPLYYILKEGKTDSGQNLRITITAFGIYACFAVIIALRIGSITEFMRAENASLYLILQTVAMTAGFLLTLMIILFTLHGMSRLFYIMTVSRLVLLACMDAVFLPRFSEYGAAYSDIAVNAALACMAFALAYKRNLISAMKSASCKEFYKSWVKTGIPVGLQIFLDNWIYAVLVVRMVNAVYETGAYWMANNFIWGWLLIPVSALGEMIKRSRLSSLKSRGVWLICAAIAGIWIITVPVWSLFLKNAMSLDADEVMPVVTALVPFYFAYIVCAVFDSWFISCGKTWCTAAISVLVNIGYYGFVYMTVFKNITTAPDLNFIIRMFGFGMVAHMFFGLLLYAGVSHSRKWNEQMI